jgi:hypothetical protein
MNTYQEVYFVENRPKEYLYPVERKDVFQYRHQSGWYGWERRWLQRLCCWLLGKLGSFYVEEVKEIKVTRHIINPDKFMEKLDEQQKSLWKYFKCDAERLLIGVEDYRALSGEIGRLPPHMFSFTGRYIYDRRIMGLKIQVIPWMKGLLVVPKFKEDELWHWKNS